jgi:outer membrane protein assembly factor BamB
MKALPLAAAAFFLGSATQAVDWPHYRGSALSGVTTEQLPGSLSGEPKRLWKQSLGTGVSTATVVGGHLFTMGNERDFDFIYCLDTATGKEIWKHKFRLPVDAKNFEGGPRSTPTYEGGKIYTVSHSGDVWCLDAASGKPLWNKHLMEDFKGRRPSWGYAGSPTIEGGSVLLDAGGERASTIALDKQTGALVWKSGSEEAGYGSVVVGTIDGQRTAVVFKAKAVVGLSVKDGRELWTAPWKTSYDVNATTPVIIGNQVLITSGYGTGATLIEIGGGKVTTKWRNKNLRGQFNSPVVWQGHIYGIDGNDGSRGQLVCLDLATGELRWKETIGGGALICADGKLIILNEKGEVIVADAAPSGFRRIARWQALGGHCWVQPVLANGRLFVRNNAGDMAAFEMK